MNASHASYFAGFFDGDGSLHFQLVRQRREFLRLAREVDAFATLNYSESKRISAADVEQHLRSMGACAPVTTPVQSSCTGMGDWPDNQSLFP